VGSDTEPGVVADGPVCHGLCRPQPAPSRPAAKRYVEHMMEEKTKTTYLIGMNMRMLLVLVLASFIAIGVGCSKPHVMPSADMGMINKSELAFLRVGETKREEVVFRLGIPVARFEGDRILIYQVKFEENGTVRLYAPRLLGAVGLQDWEWETFSLVCVFGADGVLLKLSLVGAY
jgi:hypothetical protein